MRNVKMKTEVSALSPRVAFLDHQRLILNVDNSALKQRIAALAQDKIFKDGIMLCSFSFFKYFLFHLFFFSFSFLSDSNLFSYDHYFTTIIIRTKTVIFNLFNAIHMYISRFSFSYYNIILL